MLQGSVLRLSVERDRQKSTEQSHGVIKDPSLSARERMHFPGRAVLARDTVFPAQREDIQTRVSARAHTQMFCSPRFFNPKPRKKNKTKQKTGGWGVWLWVCVHIRGRFKASVTALRLPAGCSTLTMKASIDFIVMHLTYTNETGFIYWC